MSKSNFFLGVLFAFSPFLLIAQENTGDMAKPPIPIPFTLEEDGYVTLVIEDTSGIRVRNLISDTWFPAGKDTAWWDGLDDLGRDLDAAEHGVYHVPGSPVEPNTYIVKGLVHGKITPVYKFSNYNTGNPPWQTNDHVGGWLSNHNPPMAALYLPREKSIDDEEVVVLGCYVTEGYDGMAWVDLDGEKLGGKRWIGGHWTAAPYLARDDGDRAISTYRAYVGSVWETAKNSGILELRIVALTKDGDVDIRHWELGSSGYLGYTADRQDYIGGLAARDGIVYSSLTLNNEILLVDARQGKMTGSIPVNRPKGLVFDANDRLLVLSGKYLLRFGSVADLENLPAPDTIVRGLLSPVGITLDEEGKIYISDWGDSHQVKVFTSDGDLIRAIGNPGKPAAGVYDPHHMNHPTGITIDSRQQLWVAEQDYLPKRVSVWTLEGEFVRAFYGPAKYGGGGTIDRHDSTKFYYADEEHGSMEFEMDWSEKKDQLKRVLYRKNSSSLELAFRTAAPELPITYEGKKYYTNCYNTNPVKGHGTAFLFAERNGLAEPVAAMGTASQWDILKTTEFEFLWPDGVDLNSNQTGKQAFFIWSDLNEDYHVQTDEVQLIKAYSSGVTVMEDLSFCIARIDSKATQFFPVDFTPQGTPVYDINNGKLITKNVHSPGSSGGDQLLVASDSTSIITLGVGPFHRYSICGIKNGVPVWSYPNMWPGLHASHRSPKPEFPGELIGPTRLLGGFIDAKEPNVGKIWALNGNQGNIYLFTSDGMFITTLFEDSRVGIKWKMNEWEYDMDLSAISLGGENFWPNISQTSDGNIYIIDGRRSAVVHFEGADSIHRLDPDSLTVTHEDLAKCMDYFIEAEAERQANLSEQKKTITLNSFTPVVDGSLNDWPSNYWLDIDKSGVKAYFNADSKPYDFTGNIIISGERLYLAYRTGDPDLLKNSADMPIAPFITGGALDLMIASNPAADPERKSPVEGDSRLVVTKKNGKVWAMLYQAVVEGTPESEKVEFSSPWRSIFFDKVTDVSNAVNFAASNGNYEVSIPLSLLDLNPVIGDSVKGDMGILRGDGGETISRSYWSNKATAITDDVPSEAQLTPNLWGSFKFIDGPVLNPETSDMRIEVISRSNGDPILRCKVRVDNQYFVSDNSGLANITTTVKPPDLSIISIEHNDFFTISDTLVLQEDSTYTYYLTPRYADVVFNVTDKNGPLFGVEVEMSGKQNTNLSGQALFYYQPSQMEYYYKIEDEGYLGVEDRFFLDIDTTIEVMLIDASSSVNTPLIDGVTIYPNPFGDYVHIEIQEQSSRMLLYDISGVLRSERVLVYGRNTIPTGHLEKGFYVCKIINKKNSFNNLIVK